MTLRFLNGCPWLSHCDLCSSLISSHTCDTENDLFQFLYHVPNFFLYCISGSLAYFSLFLFAQVNSFFTVCLSWAFTSPNEVLKICMLLCFLSGCPWLSHSNLCCIPVPFFLLWRLNWNYKSIWIFRNKWLLYFLCRICLLYKSTQQCIMFHYKHHDYCFSVLQVTLTRKVYLVNPNFLHSHCDLTLNYLVL